MAQLNSFLSYEENVQLAGLLRDSNSFDEDAEYFLDHSMAEVTAKLENQFFDESDDRDCYLEINAGAGGTESQEWVTILLRMYSRFCVQQGLTVDLVSSREGDLNLLKSATIKVCGNFATGWLRTEAGIHRLVRNSPYDSAGRRHTSFASVLILPVIPESAAIVIRPEDIRIDTYRSGGAGGQNVNKVSSAVRITHNLSGIVTQSQSERSQHQNKQIAMDMLISKLAAAAEAKIKSETQELIDSQDTASFGHQIRSYILNPFQNVKDARTKVECSDSKRVLDGDIKQFIIAALAAGE